MKRSIRIRLLAATAMALAPALATAQVNVPPGFTWQVLAAGFQAVKHSARPARRT